VRQIFVSKLQSSLSGHDGVAACEEIPLAREEIRKFTSGVSDGRFAKGCDKEITKERRRKAHLEDFSISHQLFNRVLGIKSIPTKDLQTKKANEMTAV